MTQLLVSVRSPAEAEAALAGAADIIDIKEPARGALGRADDATVAAIVRTVAGRRQVTVALGELADRPDVPRGFEGWVKVGFAGYTEHPAQASDHHLLARGARTPVVFVAYADWRRAAAPPPTEILRFAAEGASPALLIDTWDKDGSTLLDWLPLSELDELRRLCGRENLLLAFAGSLREPQIRELLPLQADIIAVRGAACRGGDRQATVDCNAVAELANMINRR